MEIEASLAPQARVDGRRRRRLAPQKVVGLQAPHDAPVGTGDERVRAGCDEAARRVVEVQSIGERQAVQHIGIGGPHNRLGVFRQPGIRFAHRSHLSRIIACGASVVSGRVSPHAGDDILGEHCPLPRSRSGLHRRGDFTAFARPSVFSVAPSSGPRRALSRFISLLGGLASSYRVLLCPEEDCAGFAVRALEKAEREILVGSPPAPAAENSENLNLVSSPAVAAAYTGHWRQRLAVSARLHKQTFGRPKTVLYS